MIRYDITEAQEDEEGYTGPRRLVGLQKIAPDGKKRFNKGIGMEAAACRLGGAPKSGELILLTEGSPPALRCAWRRPASTPSSSCSTPATCRRRGGPAQGVSLEPVPLLR
jgi:hypothetical protein